MGHAFKFSLFTMFLPWLAGFILQLDGHSNSILLDAIRECNQMCTLWLKERSKAFGKWEIFNRYLNIESCCKLSNTCEWLDPPKYPNCCWRRTRGIRGIIWNKKKSYVKESYAAPLHVVAYLVLCFVSYFIIQPNQPERGGLNFHSFPCVWGFFEGLDKGLVGGWREGQGPLRLEKDPACE